MKYNSEVGNSEGSKESDYQMLTSLGDFNPNAAMTEVEKAEAMRAREKFDDSIKEKIDLELRIDQAYKNKMMPAESDIKEFKKCEAAADKYNDEFIHDDEYSKLRKEYELPF